MLNQPTATKVLTTEQQREDGKIYTSLQELQSEVSSLDLIIVLGGGVPKSLNEPPIYVQKRCDDAIEIHQFYNKRLEQTSKRDDDNLVGPGNDARAPKILTVSAGTAHMPQLMSSSSGLPVWESTSSAAYIINKYSREGSEYHFDPSLLLVETTSYDTIGNAYYTRLTHTDLHSEWTNILVITNEFHIRRSKAIFDWILLQVEPRRRDLAIHYWASANVGLSDRALQVRKQHEERSTQTIQQIYRTKYKTMRQVWEFMNYRHDFYTATSLVRNSGNKEESSTSGEEGNHSSNKKDTTNNRSEELQLSYGKT